MFEQLKKYRSNEIQLFSSKFKLRLIDFKHELDILLCQIKDQVLFYTID